MSPDKPNKAHYAPYWEEVETFFNELPSQLFHQGRLLRNNLAVHYSDTGSLRDILNRENDYPPIALPAWLLDDFQIPQSGKRARIEKHLVMAEFYTFAAIYTQESILDESSFFDNEYVYLAETLSAQADRHFSRIVPVDSQFWEFVLSFRGAFAEASLYGVGQIAGSATTVTPEDVVGCRDSLAPFKAIPTAAAFYAGKEAALPELLSTFDHLHLAVKIFEDLSNLQVDLIHGRFTYPILFLMSELGLPREKRYNPEAIAAAMTLTNSFARMLDMCQNEIAAFKKGASDLGLSSLITYIDHIETHIQEKVELSAQKKESLEKKDAAGTRPEGSRPEPTEKTLLMAVHMAEGCLLADRTFKESWEVHRRGFLGAEEVSARFPAGLIIETLCQGGFDMAEEVDWFLGHLIATNYSYYDHPGFPYADADNLGTLLRLYPYCSHPESYRQALEAPLSWMEAGIEGDGQIPVWINEPGDAEQSAGDMRLIGDGCGTIEANLLLGLIGYDWEGYREIIQASAAQLLGRFIDQGPGISVNYPRLMCLWVIGELLEALSGSEISDDLRLLVQGAEGKYPEYLSSEAARHRVTHQEAAFLTLASLNPIAEHLFKERWVTILLKNQRSDGSWYGEPFFFVPNRGEVTTWHTSHLLTSAYCYWALKIYSHLGE